MLLTEPSAPVASGLSDDHVVWPWEAEPYRLWSLLDMKLFAGAVWIVVMRDLEYAHHSLMAGEESARDQLAEAVKGVLEEGERIPLRKGIVEQAKRIQQYLASDLNHRSLGLLASELRENLAVEFTEYLFFVVPPDRKEMYLHPEEWFSASVVEKFPDTATDVREAARCYALARWTAAVFHAMRILEHGLRWLAEAVAITPATPVELANWKNVIDQIDRKLRDMEQAPRSTQKSADLQWYSETAAQFRLFKDAWRNHVAHSRASYDNEDAAKVLTGVRDFMRHIVEKA